MLVHCRTSLLLLACWTSGALGSITVYGPNGASSSGITSGTASASPSASSDSYVPPAFNTVTLEAPALPTPAPATQFALSLQQSADSVQGLSIDQSGTFYGFSIEMSVVTQVGESYPLSLRALTEGLRVVGKNS